MESTLQLTLKGERLKMCKLNLEIIKLLKDTSITGKIILSHEKEPI